GPTARHVSSRPTLATVARFGGLPSRSETSTSWSTTPGTRRGGLPQTSTSPPSMPPRRRTLRNCRGRRVPGLTPRQLRHRRDRRRRWRPYRDLTGGTCIGPGLFGEPDDEAMCSRRLDVARRDRIHADALRPNFLRQP